MDRTAARELVKIARSVLSDDESVISKAELRSYAHKLEILVAEYQRYVKPSKLSPSAPDTSKFFTMREGFLKAVVDGTIGYDYVVLGWKMGTEWGWKEHPSDAKEWNRAYNERKRLVDEFKAKANAIMEPLGMKYAKFLVFTSHEGGSAWESGQLVPDRNVDVIRVSDGSIHFRRS